MSGPCLSSSVPDHPLKPGTRRRLGEPLPHQLADRTRANPAAAAFATFTLAGPWGINPPFGGLSPSAGHVTHVLLTRAPLGMLLASYPHPPYDLHVLNTPPAFVLSQNQTLRKKRSCRVSTTKLTRISDPTSRKIPKSLPFHPTATSRCPCGHPCGRGARFNLFHFTRNAIPASCDSFLRPPCEGVRSLALQVLPGRLIGKILCYEGTKKPIVSTG